MIDRTLLTEALAQVLTPTGVVLLPGENMPEPSPMDWTPIIEAARLLLDFPTDQQVEAACQNHYGVWFEDDARMMRKTLEAVRDTMIGEPGG